jgi:Heliorhodopsin
MQFSLKDLTLKEYNLGLAILHLILGVGFYLYFGKINRDHPNDALQGVELSTRNHNLTFNVDSLNHVVPKWESTQTSITSVKTVQNLLVGFFFVTAAFHFTYYMTNDGLYKTMIKNGNNYMRWVEYSISSTMMLYIIALVSSVKDVNIYRMIFATNIAMIYTGQIIEEKVREEKDWLPAMVVGFTLLLVEFGVIVCDFRSRMNDLRTASTRFPSMFGGRSIPSWIQYMVWVLFFFFSSFGIISLVGAYSNMRYESVEKIYILFSLLAKATLAGFIGYGTSQRQAAEN